MPDYKQDRHWADTYGPQVSAILRQNLGVMADVQAASDEDDMKHATDLVVIVPEGTIALRVRREAITYRDLTLRHRRLVGNEWVGGYETSKIHKGWARWYFYAWTHGNDIGDWILVDLHAVRQADLIRKSLHREKRNPDGATTFIHITLQELRDAGAMVAEHLTAKPQTNRRKSTSGMVPLHHCPACRRSAGAWRKGPGRVWICSACCPPPIGAWQYREADMT